ncbi:hypothetical protein LJC63_09805 [Ruminococcaceae bacterium OttesenSCG-928-L11]|nr:hypothetical protein [Ruminococcaceae bacterium OttesenSCG-928-L11]
MNISNELVKIADEGFEKAVNMLWEAIEELTNDGIRDNVQFESIAGRLKAAADTHDLLTGAIPDDLARHILKYDEPFSMLQDRLYMSRDVYKPSYYNRLADEVQGLLDPLDEIDDTLEPEIEPSP